MLVALVASIAMFGGDCCQAIYVVLLSRGRAYLSGVFDGLKDLSNVVAIGGGASTVFHHSIDDVTFATFGGLFGASILGAGVGNLLSARFTGKPAVTQSQI